MSKIVKTGPNAMDEAKPGYKLIDGDYNSINVILLNKGYLEKVDYGYTIVKKDVISGEVKRTFLTKEEMEVITSGWKEL